MTDNRPRVWRRIFTQKGGSDSQTRLWEDWDDATQSELLSRYSLRENESPVILSCTHAAEYVLLTSQRLLWGQCEVELVHICDVMPLDFGKTQKILQTHLEIKTRSGKKLSVQLSPGASFFGMWNVLRNIVEYNNKSRA